jgi:G3E family GTPase
LNRTVLIVLSGFLGSGKTTLMLQSAEHLRSCGYSVACITNDQGEQLVDSKMVLKKELPLAQIQGGCFCCRFDDLTDSIARIVAEHRPDIIIAEAVGSCTDLIATVVKPLEKYHGTQIDVRPLTVVVDPARLTESLSDTSAFTSEIIYLFRKQLEEAQYIVLNKIDMLTEPEVRCLEEELIRTYTGDVVSISSLEDISITDWLFGLLHGEARRPMPALDIDYDVYAEGESQLGWFNGSFLIRNLIEDASALCHDLMELLTLRLQTEHAEVAHLKLWAEDGENALKISSVSNSKGYRTDLSPSAGWTTEHLTIWVNARVHVASERLEQIMTEEVSKLEARYQVHLEVDRIACFTPGRPIPTNRMD